MLSAIFQVDEKLQKCCWASIVFFLLSKHIGVRVMVIIMMVVWWCDANYYVHHPFVGAGVHLCGEETISLIEIYTWKPFMQIFPYFPHFSCFSSSFMYPAVEYNLRMMMTRKDFVEMFCKAYHNNDDAKNHCVAQEFIKFNSASF